MDKIVSLTGREILNGRGMPTVEVELTTDSGISVSASVPSGTSTGAYEAHELFDGGPRYRGRGTRKAASNVSTILQKKLIGMDVSRQSDIDQLMCDLDGTPNKSALGANAILPVSLAAAKASALSQKEPLYAYLHRLYEYGSMRLPDIVATVISGGVFSPSGLEFEDYMYVLSGFSDFSQQLEALSELRYQLGIEAKKRYGDILEDGGALAPPLSSSEEAFDLMLSVAGSLGLEQHVAIGLDVAATELFSSHDGKYKLGKNSVLTKEELMERYAYLCNAYPVGLIEDGLEENDFEGFNALKALVPGIQIVGDDLFATNVDRINKGLEFDSANSLLLKVNQIGTLTEALDASTLAQSNGMDVIVSLRSGETEDSFISDLAVGIGARQIKLGSPVRLERNVKYNRLLRIAEDF
jgi:enolase